MAVKKEQAKGKSIENSKDSSATKPSKSEPQSPDWLTRQNVEAISQLEEAAREQRTSADRIADVIANFCGSMTFVWVHVIWFGLWIGYNVLPGVKHIDPFPFTFLTLVVSLEAIFLSCFVLISQNRQAQKDKVRADIEYDVNIKAELEIAHLHEKTDRMYENMMARFEKLDRRVA